MTTGRSSNKSPLDLSGQIPLDSIPTAQVATYFGRSQEGGDGETWRVTLIGSAKPAWVKFDDDKRHMIAEMVSAQVGRALGLSIPKPYLVEIDLARVPEDSKWHGRQGLLHSFGCQHAGDSPRSFARAIKENDPAIIETIRKWAGYNTTMIFDEWIANTDRNLGNLLFDPGANGFWLIDHGRALTGEYWPVWGLSDPSIDTGNQLAKSLARGKPDPKQTAEVESSSNNQMLTAAALDWCRLDVDAHIAKIDAKVSVDEIRRFLMSRIYHTTQLLMAKLGCPQLDLGCPHADS